MAKLSSLRRIAKEDFPSDQHEFIDKLGYPINNFMQETIDALNKKITIDDNLNQFWKTVDVFVDENGLPKAEVVFQSSVGRVKGLSLEKLDNLTNNNIYPTSSPFITWEQNGNIIKIKHITGLLTSYKYRLTLLLKG